MNAPIPATAFRAADRLAAIGVSEIVHLTQEANQLKRQGQACRERREGLAENCHVVVFLCFVVGRLKKGKDQITFFSSSGALRAMRSIDSGDRSRLW